MSTAENQKTIDRIEKKLTMGAISMLNQLEFDNEAMRVGVLTTALKIAISECGELASVTRNHIMQAAEIFCFDLEGREAFYIRLCDSRERVSDMLKEAREHNCVLAFRRGVVMIMPILLPGWKLYPSSDSESPSEESEIDRATRLTVL